ncbi:hypothetical protein B484DRAFT_405440 [Ochromonadaceae sp. CCMP2298]|nr:hypothetical protein B484DRAFT_405440 [Ochromonadaceae sp. CCMP2298]
MSAKRDSRRREDGVQRNKQEARTAASPGLKLLDKDPGAGSTLWSSGPASQFVVARQIMEVRAKAAGVWELWSGDESSEFTLLRPSVTYMYEPDYAEPSVSASSPEGKAMLSASTEGYNDGSETPVRTTPVFRCAGNKLAEENPLYTPQGGEVCSISGMEFGKLVRKTSDYDKFQSHIDKQSEQLLRWTSAQREHKKRVSLADATLMACLGPSAQAVVKKLLKSGEIFGAWEALNEKYAPAQDSDVIQQLTQHVKSLKMKSPTRLEEYFGSLDTLQDALEESGARIEEHELLAIVKGAVLGSAEGMATYGSAFTNARQFHWSLDRLTSVLVSDCHELVQAAGIADLKEAEFREEMQRRRISQQTANHKAEPREGGVVPFAGAVTAGTDGKTWEGTKCYKCEQYGHVARNCPNPKPSKAAAATTKEKDVAAPDTPDERSESSQSPPSDASSKKASFKGDAKPAAASSATAGGHKSATGKFFTVESDDNYASDASSEDSGAGACQSSATTLDLFPDGMGDPQRRA